MPQNSAIFIKDLTVVLDKKPVIWDLDFHAPTGSMMAIVGPNGSGKTTLLKSILGITKPTTGTIHKRTHQIAYVPQKNSVDWTFPINVFDVVMMGRFGQLSFFARPTKHDHQIVLECLEMVGMSEYQERQISELSGGQQQRVFLARAMAQQLSIFLLDEPFVGIDMVTETIILKILQTLQKQGKTIIVVHHDLSTVAKYFDWTFMMNIKHIAIGPTNTVLTQENIVKTFYTQTVV